VGSAIRTKKKCDYLSDKQVRLVIKELKAGFGVEDIEAKNICSATDARRVVKFLKDFDFLDRIVKDKKNVDDDSGRKAWRKR